MTRDSERTRVTRLTEIGAVAKPARPGDACIIVIYGPELGKRLPLGTAPFTIGRSSKNDLFLDQESISRHHARITFDSLPVVWADESPVRRRQMKCWFDSDS